MDLFDDLQDTLGKGKVAAQGAVSNAAVERQAFMRGFARLCNDGWLQGWHERNGGNLTYRMTDDEVKACKPFFKSEPSDWTQMSVHADNLRSAYFTTTGAGRYMRNVEADIAHNVGIVEINEAGDAYRIVWGLEGGGVPTSEFTSHFMCHSIRAEATRGSCHVMYHAHPDNVIALTKVLPLDARTVTRALWKAMTECVMVFPMGVGVVECMVPGGPDLAHATSKLMETYDAAIWANHGLFASGPDFDATFGLMHAIEKAAKIHGLALAMNGGSDGFANTISDECLRAIARNLSLTLNEDFLD